MAAPRIGSILGVGFLGVLAAVGYWFYREQTKKDEIIEEQQRVIGQLGEKLDRVWAEELTADVRVHRVSENPETGEPEMDLTFVQYAPGQTEPVLKKRMTLPGNEFYIDALVVKFDRALVEAGDGLKGKSLLLFRRAFGDRQRPLDGEALYRIDSESVVPKPLQVDAKPSEFETKLWERFWELANDPDKAAKEGIRVAQGEAPHMRAAEGQVYRITLRKSGGLEIKPRLPMAVTNEDEGAGDAGAGEGEVPDEPAGMDPPEDVESPAPQ